MRDLSFIVLLFFLLAINVRATGYSDNTVRYYSAVDSDIDLDEVISEVFLIFSDQGESPRSIIISKPQQFKGVCMTHMSGTGTRFIYLPAFGNWKKVKGGSEFGSHFLDEISDSLGYDVGTELLVTTNDNGRKTKFRFEREFLIPDLMISESSIDHVDPVSVLDDLFLHIESIKSKDVYKDSELINSSGGTLPWRYIIFALVGVSVVWFIASGRRNRTEQDDEPKS